MFNTLKTLTAALAFAGSALAATQAAAEAVPMRWTPPSGMTPGPVNGTMALIETSAAGVGSVLETHSLPPGHVVTVWFVAIQKPQLCSKRPCTPPDGMGKAALVDSVVANAGGGIVAADGTFRHASFTPAGKVHGNFFTSMLTSPETAEIHLAVQDHGPLIADRAEDMMGSYRANCTDASVPPFYPDTARVDGTPGDYACKVLQFAVLVQDGPATN